MSDPVYETDRALREYLLFHYGAPEEVLPWELDPGDGALAYPARCARLAVDACASPPSRALDLGCAVGRTTFELARRVPEVVGIDLSVSFVTAAQRLARDGELGFSFQVRGGILRHTVARVSVGIDRSRVRFEVADATDLPAELGDFDLVVLANLIDRLPDPRLCLARLAGRVRPGGTLFVSSPYTWLEEFTPRERWLGATAEEPDAAAALGAALGDGFELIARHDLPFLLREHERKFQWSMAEATIWRRLE
ncbi:MAG TPA: putative 4-mercaptohistidine N1-methyltransferase [Thermoanaerobaculia bacterium]|nr:putative 4-mercaptohistidine N1-methyltransferase [Thermoanaerobaculia bacterium]